MQEITNKIKNRSNWKNRILMFLYFGIAYSTIMFLINYFITKNHQPFFFYLLSSFIYGFIMTFIFPDLIKKVISNKLVPELEEQEIIQISKTASLIKNREAIGGKIFLTNKKIIFKPHKFKIQKISQINLNYSNIHQVLEINKSFFIKNRLKMCLKNTEDLIFMVDDRKAWIEAINERI